MDSNLTNELNSKLMDAALKGDASAIEPLMEFGADPTHKGHPNFKKNNFFGCWMSPLMWAAEKGHYDFVKALIPYLQEEGLNAVGGMSDLTALMYAVVNGHVEIIKVLAPHLDAAGLNAAYGYEKNTALMVAVKIGDVDVLKTLLPYLDEAKLNTVNAKKETALMLAAKEGYVEIVKILLPYIIDVADLNLVNECKETALFLAIEKGHLEVVQALIPRLNSAGLNAWYGWNEITALMLAVKKGDIEMVKAIAPHLDAAGLNALDDGFDAKTALMLAVKNDDVEMVKVLVSFLDFAGLNTVSGHFHETALNIAINRNNAFTPAMVSALLPYLDSVGLNIINPTWNLTPFKSAIRYKNVATVSVFVSYFLAQNDMVSLNSADGFGHTALTQAVELDNLAIVDVLLKAKVDTTHIVPNLNKNALGLALSRALLSDSYNIIFRFLTEKHPQELAAMQSNPNSISQMATKFLTVGLRQSPTMGTSLLKAFAKQCILEVNTLRNTLFQTLYAFRNRLPDDSTKSILLYVGGPEWYQHRFNKDLQSMSEQVIDVLNERKHKAKALALQHKYEALASSENSTDEHSATKRSRTFLCGSKPVKRLKNLAEAPSSSRHTGAPEYDAYDAPRAEGSNKRLRGG
jgi:ankyrin repeat protein